MKFAGVFRNPFVASALAFGVANTPADAGADIVATNGVIQVIDTVVLPN